MLSFDFFICLCWLLQLILSFISFHSPSIRLSHYHWCPATHRQQMVSKKSMKNWLFEGSAKAHLWGMIFFPRLILCRSQPTNHTWVYLPSRSKLWPSGLTVIMLLYDLAKRATPEHKQSFSYIWPSGRHHTCNKEKKNEINHYSDIKHLSLKYEGFKVDMLRK